tara:strand:+ start:544 stop:1254 length:711 start_codon:yes stop_codon:yes gene_type:complete
METKKRELSLFIFVCFIVLFLLFMLLSPNTGKTSNAIVGSTALGESPSVITLVILFVVLVVVLAVVFFIFKKLKKKKLKVKAPQPSEEVKGEKKIGEKPREAKKESKSDLEEGDIDKLFSGNGVEEPKTVEKPKPKEDHVQKLQQPQKKEVLANLQDMKNKIKGMLTQKLTKEQIIARLKTAGMNIDQINKAIEEVNLDNLRGYVTQALKQGFAKDQVVRNLAAHGWKKEQIEKVI